MRLFANTRRLPAIAASSFCHAPAVSGVGAPFAACASGSFQTFTASRTVAVKTISSVRNQAVNRNTFRFRNPRRKRLEVNPLCIVAFVDWTSSSRSASFSAKLERIMRVLSGDHRKPLSFAVLKPDAIVSAGPPDRGLISRRSSMVYAIHFPLGEGRKYRS
jgi:hypothetical protein